MKTVNQVSQLTGVSVRTLHHYDAIGLLKPSEVTMAGYRLYDDAALARLHTILLFRELQFPLKVIKEMLDRSDFDTNEALLQQIQLLELERDRLLKIIGHAQELYDKGVEFMTFSAFDKTQINQYKDEVKERWGNTEAYAQYEEKDKKGTNFADAGETLMAMFADLGKMRQFAPSDAAVQDRIRVLQQFITENFYNCTPEILYGLGQMYTQDERFRRNIDHVGGEGTAEFVRQAIMVYCGKA